MADFPSWLQPLYTDDWANPPEPPARASWWLCPNTPRCPHGAALHDVEELGDPSPRCCSEGCPCGAQAKREGTE